MTTRFWWVRHGPTHAKGMVGWRDIPADLSDEAGIARLEAALPADAKVISSDLIRASATADAIQGNRTRLSHHTDLREMNFGMWDGVPFAEIAKMDPEGSKTFWTTPGDFAPPEGESWNALSARVKTAVEGLNEDHPDADIVVVAHFAVILCAIQIAAGLAPKQAFSFKIDNLSVTQLDFIDTAEAWRVNGINHVM